MDLLFENLLVVELASVLAGPYAGRFFKEHGARVIKVENPNQGGDVTRTWRNSKESNDGISAYYASVNQGKEVIFLDLKSTSDKENLLELLSRADVLITNFRQGEDLKFGLQLDVLKRLFPQLIIGQIDGFASDDPRAAYDMVLQAETGYLSMSGSEGHPAKMPVALIDVMAGQQLKTGILMALLQKSKTQTGCIVRVSLKEAAISALMNQASNYLMSGFVPTAMGTLHPNIAPYGEYFICSDGKQLVLAIGNNKQFEALLEVLELSKIYTDPRFSNNPSRVKHRRELAEILQSECRKFTLEELMKRLIKSGVPAGSIKQLDEVLDDPSIEWLIEENRTETGQTLRSVKTSPIRFE
jgi:crotonobetainyl-CoA:carnitine CoA-transferase CaiB-like acyl-CoA transferase